MSMQSVASPALTFTAAKAQCADAHPGRRRLAARRQDAARCSPTPRAKSSGWPPNTARSIAAASFGETNHRAARAGSQRARAVRPGQAVLVDPSAGTSPRPAVSARPDAARFRRASAAPPRAVGRVQVRADEILSRGARRRHRGAGRAMEGQAGRDAVLSGDEAAHARSCGDVVPRRRHRSRGRRDHPRLRRHGGRGGRADPHALARHADGARRQGAQTHRRLFLRTDSDPPRQARRRRSVLATLPRHP